MIKEISHQRWLEAQAEERKHHTLSYEEGCEHYGESYKHYFNYTGGKYDLECKSVIEIGPAKVAALLFCKNYAPSYIIEPCIYEDVVPYYENRNITFIREPAETCNFPQVDEAWLFNVLQHVINPTEIINVCKKNVKTIRFFEPLDWGGDIAHPHILTLDYFKEQFGDKNVKFYKGGTITKNFHQANCAYGVWNKS